MKINYKSILIGAGVAVGLKIIVVSFWIPLALSVLAAAKVDKDINAIRGIAYGVILGLILSLFYICLKGYNFGPLLIEINGLALIAVLGGAIGAVVGKLLKGRGGSIWW